MKSHTEDQPATPPTNDAVVPSKLSFPVVGIGASAGGLQALFRFFENMPAANGMSFVIILHLSPSDESTADSVLQRATSMPVIMVNESVKNKYEHVAPNKHLTRVDAYFSLADLDRPRGTHIAIDTYFRTLVEVHSE